MGRHAARAAVKRSGLPPSLAWSQHAATTRMAAPRGASRSPSPQRDIITAPHPHAAITIRPRAPSLEAPPLARKRVSLAQVTKRMQWDSDIDDDLDSTDSSGAYSVRSATSSFMKTARCRINVKQLTPLIIAGVLCAAAAISVQPIVAHVVEERAREAIVIDTVNEWRRLHENVVSQISVTMWNVTNPSDVLAGATPSLDPVKLGLVHSLVGSDRSWVDSRKSYEFSQQSYYTYPTLDADIVTRSDSDAVAFARRPIRDVLSTILRNATDRIGLRTGRGNIDDVGRYTLGAAVGARTRVKPLRREDAKVKGAVWSDALQKHVALIDDGAMNVKGVACRRVVFEAVNSTVDGYDIDADIDGFGGYAPSTTSWAAVEPLTGRLVESQISTERSLKGWPLVTTVESYEWSGKDARRHIEDYDTPKKAARGCMVAFAVLALLIGGATCALHVAFNRPRSQSLASVISVMQNDDADL